MRKKELFNKAKKFIDSICEEDRKHIDGIINEICKSPYIFAKQTIDETDYIYAFKKTSEVNNNTLEVIILYQITEETVCFCNIILRKASRSKK